MMGAVRLVSRRSFSSGTAPAGWAREVLPGFLAAGAVATGGFALAVPLGGCLGRARASLSPPSAEQSDGSTASSSASVSGISVAILLGAAAGTALRRSPALWTSLAPGLAFASSTALRVGIVCVGAKLSLAEATRLGATGVPAVFATVAVGLGSTMAIARFAGLPPRLGALIAGGTSICGVTAIMALAPVIRASQAEVAVAVANVVLFGSIGMVFFPFIADAAFPTPEQAGMWLGLAVHDTAQVMGAGAACAEICGDEAALRAAAVTKLTRNLALAVVIPLLALQQGGGSGAGAAAAGGAGAMQLSHLKAAVPIFVPGFIAMVLIRSLGDWYVEGEAEGSFLAERWHAAVHTLGSLLGAKVLLGTAMAAVGMQMSPEKLRGLGWRPFAVGVTAATIVATTGAVATTLVGAGGSGKGGGVERIKEEEAQV